LEDEMKRLTKSFVEGLVIIVPLFATVYVVFRLFEKIDGLLGISIPGVGFLITLVLIVLVGFIASNYLTQGFLSYVEGVLARLPLAKILYPSFKDLTEAFVGDKKSFDKPVLVKVTPGSEAKALGFITSESLEFLGLKDHVAVYFPQSYNFAGSVIIYPKDQVQPLDAEGAKIMAFLMSGGVSDGS
jgi:uncharacterized membrane protein